MSPLFYSITAHIPLFAFRTVLSYGSSSQFPLLPLRALSVAMAMGVEFSKYLIAPCGSFTKIARSEDGRVLYSLHTDESFSLFPRRNFNLALKAFLHCLGELACSVFCFGVGVLSFNLYTRNSIC